MEIANWSEATSHFEKIFLIKEEVNRAYFSIASNFKPVRLVTDIFLRKMANVQSKLESSKKRKIENSIEQESEIFLKILVELVTKEPEEAEKLIKEGIDKPDGPKLDAVLLAVSKLRELLKADIDSLNLPNFMKTSIKLLKTFLDFLNTSKILHSLKKKNGSNKNNSAKRIKTTESSSTSIESNQ